MARLKRFSSATQDAKGFWWAEDEDGNRYAVEPFSEVDSESGDEFTGYREVDRQNEANVGQQGAGLPMDSWRWKSGQVLTPQDMQEISRIMSLPGRLVGVNGPMSVEQYLADPRSTVKVENGQYVYRPEQAQGDWESIDRESFMQSLGAIPALLGMAAGPFMQVAGIGSLGSAGAAAGSAGAEFFPNVHGFLGDVANVGAGAGGAAGAAGAASGAFTSELPMGEFSNPLTTTTPQVPPPATWESSLGLPSLDAPLQSVLEPLATTPTNAALGQSLGLPSGGLDAILQNTGLTMTNPLGASLAPVTVSAAGDLLSNVAGGAASNLSTQVAGAGGTTGVGAAASTVPQTASSALSQFLKNQLGVDVSPGALDLIGKGLGLGLGYLGSKEQADAMQNLYNQQVSLGAPYRAELANLNANPSSFYNSDMFKGALQQGSDALARSLSAKVGNPILNPTALQEMQNYTTKGSLDAYNQRWNQLSSAGQLGLGAVPNLGSAAAQASGNTYNAIGAGLGSVFGNQRDYAGEYLDLIRRQQQGGSNYSLP